MSFLLSTILLLTSICCAVVSSPLPYYDVDHHIRALRCAGPGLGLSVPSRGRWNADLTQQAPATIFGRCGQQRRAATSTRFRRSVSHLSCLGVSSTNDHSSKYQNGFAAYFRNVGQPHPLDTTPFENRPESNIARREMGFNPLTDENNGRLWQGTISVGTPPVTYTVDFDTGSSDLFLPGPTCNAASCKTHQKYNPSASSTSVDRKQQFSLAYEDKSTVSGEQYYDTVSISGLTVRCSTPLNII